jgi:hypothetical protein
MVQKRLHLIAVVLLVQVVCTGANDKNQSSHPRFADYPVGQLYSGKPVTPKIPDTWHNFRTRIQKAASLPPNFAGHYRIVQWDNGLDTRVFVLLDLSSGVIYDPPFESLWLDAYSTEGWYGKGLAFRADSRLLVAEGCPTEHCGTFSYEWTGVDFKLIHVANKRADNK